MHGGRKSASCREVNISAPCQRRGASCIRKRTMLLPCSLLGEVGFQLVPYGACRGPLRGSDTHFCPGTRLARPSTHASPLRVERCVRAARSAMGTLINGADAGVAIVTSAVAAANATLVRAHQVIGQVDGLASDWAQSPVGNIIGAGGSLHACASAPLAPMRSSCPRQGTVARRQQRGARGESMRARAAQPCMCMRAAAHGRAQGTCASCRPCEHKKCAGKKVARQRW